MVQRPETHLAGDLASTPAAQKEYELLKILAEHYFGSMLVTDDRGRFLYVSDGTCRLLGVDRETLLQLSIYDTLKGYCFATSASSIKTLETKQECLSNHTLTRLRPTGACPVPALTSARTGNAIRPYIQLG